MRVKSLIFLSRDVNDLAYLISSQSYDKFEEDSLSHPPMICLNNDIFGLYIGI